MQDKHAQIFFCIDLTSLSYFLDCFYFKHHVFQSSTFVKEKSMT